MATGDMLSQRLDTLEMRAMYQDQTIEELNATITSQWRRIDQLTRLIQQIDSKLNETVSGSTPPDRPPPHY